MGREVERKFLVTGDAWRAAAGPGVRMRQGYLSRDPRRTVRIRRAGPAGFLTVKGPGTVDRAEFEYPIPAGDADAMLDALCEPGQVDKTRFRVPHAGLVWEVDVFGGRHEGLVLAEVELAEPDQPVPLPPWAGAEVSGDPAYTNAELSRP